MKARILILCVLVGLMSCRKDGNNQEPPNYLIHDFNSLVVKSYDTLYYYTPSNGTDPPPYYVYIPQENSVTYSFDIDQDTKNDFGIRIGHNLFSSSPHFYYAQKYADIFSPGPDCSIAVNAGNVPPDIKEFRIGDTVNYKAAYDSAGRILQDFAGSGNIQHSGNINIGWRKQLQNSVYRYGYLNIIVEGAKVTFIKSVMNTNRDQCLVTY